MTKEKLEELNEAYHRVELLEESIVLIEEEFDEYLAQKSVDQQNFRLVFPRSHGEVKFAEFPYRAAVKLRLKMIELLEGELKIALNDFKAM